MKKLRVLVLMHEDLVPPEDLEGHTDAEIAEWKTEYDVVTTLREMGHDVQALGVSDDLGQIRRAILRWKPHVAFNLLEEFHGVGVYDQHVVSYLELMRQPYTGCNPRGLLLAHDKALSKQILSYHRIPTPKFAICELGKAIKVSKKLQYPLFVKSVIEEASLGITKASVVNTEDKLRERIEFIHQEIQTDALVEEFIDGRELYVGVVGNTRLQTYPVWEMLLTKAPQDEPWIATAQVKWDTNYQEKMGVITQAARKLPPGVEAKILKLCKRIYRSLNLSGYARMDLRMTTEGRLFVLEANPNPNLSYGEDFAESAENIGINYDALLQRIMNLALSYRAAWRG